MQETIRLFDEDSHETLFEGCVLSCEEDGDSLIHTVRSIIALRHEYEDLQADAEFEVVYAKKGERILIYRRGNLLIAVNPGLKEVSATIEEKDIRTDLIYSIGNADTRNGHITLGGQSFAIWK